ncbi:hypothetical protein [Marinococcus halotolerans]|uniref:hypothetical protein n=1 Tax=Marinococcus halotolerans TaxID=301092 RepID=UPI0003B6E264|nr:hypothetical protein [Marinococcus halotolerans]
MNNEITFLSTIITSSAALVAIIAGFLVSRVISISSEQNAIHRRIKSLRINRDGMKERRKNLEQRIEGEEYKLLESYYYLEPFMLQMDIRGLISGNDITRASTESLYQLINKDDFNVLSEEQIRKHIGKIRSYLYKWGDAYAVDSQVITHDFNKVYELIEHDDFPDDRAKERRLYSLFIDLVTPRVNDNSKIQIKQTNEHGENLKQLDNDISSLDREIEGQQHLLTEYANPSGVYGALVVLSLSIILGVIIPSIVLTLQIEFFAWMWWLFAAFILHVSIICIYLWIFVINLNDNAKQNSSK